MATKRTGLGRGIGALIPTGDDATRAADCLQAQGLTSDKPEDIPGTGPQRHPHSELACPLLHGIRR